MHKSARIQQGLLSHRIFASVLDIVTFFIVSVLFQLLLLYTVFSIFGYSEMQSEIKEIEEQHSLTLKSNAEYYEYEKVIQDIYFNKYPNEIVNEYKQLYGDNFSIVHIYNIVVLRLPVNPTFDNYKTDYYQYVQKEDGSFDVDAIGVMVEGKGSYYERNLQSLFYSGYKRMDDIVEKFDHNYYTLNVKTYSYECYARIISFVVCFVLWFIIIPLTKREYATLWMRKFDLAFVDSRQGYFLSKRKLTARYIITYLLPLVGFIFATKYSIIILIIGYILIDHLSLLFSKDNNNIADRLLKIETCKLSESLLFVDEEAEKAFLESEEGKKLSDESFVQKLEDADEIIVVNYDEKQL